MFNVIISCCISFITLFILLFKNKDESCLKIPAWFLGSRNKLNFKKNYILKKPPILPYIFVIFSTILAGYIYLPKNQILSKESEKEYALIWLDPSLPAKLSRGSSKFSAVDEAKKIYSLHYKTYGLKNEFLILNGNLYLNYEIIFLNNEESILNFINNQENAPPSPFHQSLKTDLVTRTIKNYENFKNKKGNFFVYSDGNENSMLGVYLLSNLFSNAHLIKSSNSYSMLKEKQQIILNKLANDWDLNHHCENKIFCFYDDKDRKIPNYFLPNLYKMDFIFNSYKISLIDHHPLTSFFPMVIACSSSLPGFIENDSFAGLRSLAQFFNAPFIVQECKIKSKQQPELINPFHFRKGVLWIVPVLEDISSSLFNDFKLWIPNGFDINIDSVVYVKSGSYDKNNLENNFNIEIEKSTFPFIINLAPLPPNRELIFSEEGNGLVYKTNFKLFFKSENNIPLAWKTSSLPFYYLRTAVSSPNLELSRSSRWVNFWIEAGKSVKNKSSLFDFIEIKDINSLENELENEGLNIHNLYDKYINPTTLELEKTHFFTLGLYSRKDNNKFILFKNSINNNLKVIDVNEFNSHFKNGSKLLNLQYNQDGQLKKYIYFLLFIICVISLWFFQYKEEK